MDITSILGLNNDKPSSEAASQPTGEAVNIEEGANTDALSAVKLDPAVLEAQITIDKPVQYVASNGSEGANGDRTTEKESSPVNLSFDETLMSLQENAMLNLTTQQCGLILFYVDNLRKLPRNFQEHRGCAFCKRNGQSGIHSHSLRDGNGRIQCPTLRSLICPRCGGTGDLAHTLKYCPKNIMRR